MGTGGGAKGQKRLDHILRQIPVAREQLLTAIDDLAPSFDVAAIQTRSKRTPQRLSLGDPCRARRDL